MFKYYLIGIGVIIAVILIAILGFNETTPNSVFRDRSWQLTWSEDMVKQTYYPNLDFCNFLPQYPNSVNTVNSSA